MSSRYLGELRYYETMEEHLIEDHPSSGVQSSTEDDEPVETLVKGRSKRSTAGNHMSALLNAEGDDDLALLFEEVEDDDEFAVEEEGAEENDMRLESSSEDEEDQGPNTQNDDYEGERELEAQEKAERKRRRAADPLGLPALKRKKVKIDPTVASPMPASRRPKKKSERVSWLPTVEEGPTRSSSRWQTMQNKELTNARLKDSERKRIKLIATMEESARRKAMLKPKEITQEERLAEAARVERLNSKSLNRWEETEKKKAEERRAKIEAMQNRRLEGPVISYWSGIATWVDGVLRRVGKAYITKKPEKEEVVKRKVKKGETDRKDTLQPESVNTKASGSVSRQLAAPTVQAENMAIHVSTEQEAVNARASMARTEDAIFVADGNESMKRGSGTVPPAEESVNSDENNGIGESTSAQMPGDSLSTGTGASLEHRILKNRAPNDELLFQSTGASDKPLGSPMRVENTNQVNPPDPVQRRASPKASILGTTDVEVVSNTAGSERMPLVSVVVPRSAFSVIVRPLIEEVPQSKSEPEGTRSEPNSATVIGADAISVSKEAQMYHAVPQLSDAQDVVQNNPSVTDTNTQTDSRDILQGVSRLNPANMTSSISRLGAPQPGSLLAAEPPKIEKTGRNLVVLENFDEKTAQSRDFNAYFSSRKSARLSKTSSSLCVITSLPARYRDPETGLPYANIYAYKEVRRAASQKFCWSQMLGCYVGTVDLAARGVPERFLDANASPLPKADGMDMNDRELGPSPVSGSLQQARQPDRKIVPGKARRESLSKAVQMNKIATTARSDAHTDAG